MASCKVMFKPAGVTVDVDPDKPVEGVAPAGTLLNIALANGVEIEHVCDGEGTCGLCQVAVEQGAGNLSPPTPEEEGAVDQSAASGAEVVRLACQAVVKGDVTCRVP